MGAIRLIRGRLFCERSSSIDDGGLNMARSDSGKTARWVGVPLAVAALAAGAAAAYVLVSRRRALIADGLTAPCEDEVSLYMVGRGRVSRVGGRVHRCPRRRRGGRCGERRALGRRRRRQGRRARADSTEPPDRHRGHRAGACRHTRRSRVCGPRPTCFRPGPIPRVARNWPRRRASARSSSCAGSTRPISSASRAWGSSTRTCSKPPGSTPCPELAQRRADNLTTKMNEVNEQKRLVRRTPTEAQVAAWIESAKGLPRVVTY